MQKSKKKVGNNNMEISSKMLLLSTSWYIKNLILNISLNSFSIHQFLCPE